MRGFNNSLVRRFINGYFILDTDKAIMLFKDYEYESLLTFFKICFPEIKPTISLEHRYYYTDKFQILGREEIPEEINHLPILKFNDLFKEDTPRFVVSDIEIDTPIITKKFPNISCLSLQIEIGTVDTMMEDGTFKTVPKTTTPITERELFLLEMFANIEIQEDGSKVYILNKCRFTIGFNLHPIDLTLE